MSKEYKYIAPPPKGIKWWPTYLGLALMWSLAQLPYPILVKLGKGLGLLLMKLLKSRYKVSLKNIQTCFPNLTEQEQRALVKKSFQAMAIGLMETCMCWYASEKRFQSICTIEGKEIVDELLAQGKGVLLLGYHLTTLEIGSTLASTLGPFSAMYKPSKNPVFEWAMSKGRGRHDGIMVPRDDVRSAIRRLRKGGIFWCAIDQNNASKDSPFVPFFGTPARTVTAISRYAKMGKAVVVPITQIRDSQNYKVTVKLHPPLTDIPSGDEYKDTLQVNQFLENWLKQHPEDYMWLHKRFRSQPEGSPKFYS